MRSLKDAKIFRNRHNHPLTPFMFVNHKPNVKKLDYAKLVLMVNMEQYVELIRSIRLELSQQHLQV